jgi:hypothetical protein
MSCTVISHWLFSNHMFICLWNDIYENLVVKSVGLKLFSLLGLGFNTLFFSYYNCYIFRPLMIIFRTCCVVYVNSNLFYSLTKAYYKLLDNFTYCTEWFISLNIRASLMACWLYFVRYSTRSFVTFITKTVVLCVTVNIQGEFKVHTQ